LDAYIRFRAEHEGVSYELNPEFFEEEIRGGISNFFGVSFMDGKLVSDEDFPMLFEQWQSETQRDLHCESPIKDQICVDERAKLNKALGEYDMADYWTQTVVEQSIPNVTMTSLDNFLLTHIFESEPYEDCVYFFAEESPNEIIFLEGHEPEHLIEAIEKTKDIDPELCADVKRAMQTDGDTVEVDCAIFGNYHRVFQGIIRRSGGKLPYVTTQGAFTCSKMRPDGFGGMADVITADTVESVSTFTWTRDKLVELGLEKAK
jgi:hypothetical protein